MFKLFAVHLILDTMALPSSKLNEIREQAKLGQTIIRDSMAGYSPEIARSGMSAYFSALLDPLQKAKNCYAKCLELERTLTGPSANASKEERKEYSDAKTGLEKSIGAFDEAADTYAKRIAGKAYEPAKRKGEFGSMPLAMEAQLLGEGAWAHEKRAVEQAQTIRLCE